MYDRQLEKARKRVVFSIFGRICAMKRFFGRPVTVLTVGLMVVCCSCSQTERAAQVGETPTAVEREQARIQPVEAKPVEVKPPVVEAKPAETRPAEQPFVAKHADDPNVVGEIGDYVVTKQEVEYRLINELRGYEEEPGPAAEAPDAKTVLMKLMADKAMSLEGRAQNLQQGDSSIRRFYEGRLVSLLLRTNLQDKLRVTDADIEAKLKSDPKLDRARATAMVQNERARELVEQFYNELTRKAHVRKLSENFGKAAEIHNRLLYSPQKERRGGWIANWQIQEELTPEEKEIVLATFDDGKITLLNWFETLNEMSPPSRPKDAGTVQGVEQLLDRAMRTPVFLAEARRQGLDKEENFVRELRAYEDRILFSRVMRNALSGLKRPTKEEAAEYFNSHKEEFKSADVVKVDQIWCADLKTARKVRRELRGGKDFEAVKQEYSLRKEEKAVDTTAAREGVFFKELWAGEPNEIIGPVKGFYGEGESRQTMWAVKWRVVKVLEKRPGSAREYSSVEREVEERMRRIEREARLDEYRQELLTKYPHKVYSERIGDIDPLNIP